MFLKSELILHMYNKTLIYISSLIFSDTEPQTFSNSFDTTVIAYQILFTRIVTGSQF